MFLISIASMLAALVSLIAFFWYLARYVFSKTERKPRFGKRARWAIMIFVAAFVSLVTSVSFEQGREARLAGFETSSEYVMARNEGVSNPIVWAEIVKIREAEEALAAEAIAQELANKQKELVQEAAEKAQAAKAVADALEEERIEAERLAEQERQEAERRADEEKRAEEAQCRKELSCWGEKAHTTAMISCPRYIERMAKYDYEWTDGFLGAKFSHFRWRDIDAGIVTVIGDKVKFQNGFGAWSNMIYECDVEPVSRTILDVRISDGRL